MVSSPASESTNAAHRNQSKPVTTAPSISQSKPLTTASPVNQSKQVTTAIPENDFPKTTSSRDALINQSTTGKSSVEHVYRHTTSQLTASDNSAAQSTSQATVKSPVDVVVNQTSILTTPVPSMNETKPVTVREDP